MWKVGSCLFLLLLPVISTSAVAASNVTAYVAHNVEPHSNGIQVDYTMRRNDGAGKNWYKKATVHYPKDKAKKRVMNSKGRITPLGVGLAAAVAAAGWAIDELTGQVVGVVPAVEGSFYYSAAPTGIGYGLSMNDACVNSGGTGIAYSNYCAPAYNPVLSVNCTQHPSASFCSESSQPIDDNQLWPLLQEVLNSLPPEVLRAMFENGGVPILTPELAAALAQYAAETASENGHETDPVNDESAQDEADKESLEEPLPDNKQEITQINISKVDWDSGLGSGSCPQSHSIGGMFPMSTQWGTICDAASNIFKPIFLLLCAIGSAYIVAGVRPSGTVD